MQSILGKGKLSTNRNIDNLVAKISIKVVRLVIKNRYLEELDPDQTLVDALFEGDVTYTGCIPVSVKKLTRSWRKALTKLFIGHNENNRFLSYEAVVMKNIFIALNIFSLTFIALAKSTSNTSLDIGNHIYTQSKTNLRVNKTNVSLKTQEDRPESKSKNIVNHSTADASGSNTPNHKSQNTHQNLLIATEVFCYYLGNLFRCEFMLCLWWKSRN